MSKIAFIFPGQGSQSIGMGKNLFESCDIARNVYEEFNKVLDRSISDICFEGPEDSLKQTQNTQPCILATSIAALDVFREKSGIKPAFVAGHSLGEYAALYASGVLNLEDTIKLIGKRGELMGQASDGTMAAILGLDEQKINELVKEAQAEGIVSVANYNTPEQIVITGEVSAVEKASELCSEAGAKRVVPLSVSGAFHSPLMKKASDDYKEFVDSVKIDNASIPVVTNVDAIETTEAKDFEEKMVDQIYSSVFWTQTINKMIEQGVDTFIEIGPGKVLMGMNRKISREVKTYNVFDMASLEKVIDTLNAANV